MKHILGDICSYVVNLGRFRRNLLPPSSGQKSEDGGVVFLPNALSLKSLYTPEDNIKMWIAVHKVLVYSVKHKLHPICRVQQESRNAICYQN